MVRPRRLYKDSKGRYFYIVNNQQKFVKVPKDMAEKDVVKISLKTLENLINKRRVKRRKKRQPYAFEKPVVTGAPTAKPKPTEPSKLVVEGRKIPQIEDVIKNTKQKKAEQLAENVESFFDTLANKKTGLLSGTKLITQGEKGVASEKTADQLPTAEKITQSTNSKEDRALIKTLPKKLQEIARDIIGSAGDYEDLLDVLEQKRNELIMPNQAKAFIQSSIKLKKYNLNEDEQKQIFQVLNNHNGIKEDFNEAIDEWVTKLAKEEEEEKAAKVDEERAEKQEGKKMGKEDVNVSKKPEAPAPTPPAEPNLLLNLPLSKSEILRKQSASHEIQLD